MMSAVQFVVRYCNAQLWHVSTVPDIFFTFVRLALDYNNDGTTGGMNTDGQK